MRPVFVFLGRSSLLCCFLLEPTPFANAAAVAITTALAPSMAATAPSVVATSTVSGTSTDDPKVIYSDSEGEGELEEEEDTSDGPDTDIIVCFGFLNLLVRCLLPLLDGRR